MKKVMVNEWQSPLEGLFVLACGIVLAAVVAGVFMAVRWAVQL